MFYAQFFKTNQAELILWMSASTIFLRRLLSVIVFFRTTNKQIIYLSIFKICIYYMSICLMWNVDHVTGQIYFCHHLRPNWFWIKIKYLYNKQKKKLNTKFAVQLSIRSRKRSQVGCIYRLFGSFVIQFVNSENMLFGSRTVRTKQQKRIYLSYGRSKYLTYDLFLDSN